MCRHVGHIEASSGLPYEEWSSLDEASNQVEDGGMPEIRDMATTALTKARQQPPSSLARWTTIGLLAVGC